MSDIVEWLLQQGEWAGDKTWATEPHCSEAAEEITRLRAENEKILDGMRDTIQERDILSGENYDLRKENEKLRVALQRAAERYDEWRKPIRLVGSEEAAAISETDAL